jgi:hypothetical protein
MALTQVYANVTQCVGGMRHEIRVRVYTRPCALPTAAALIVLTQTRPIPHALSRRDGPQMTEHGMRRHMRGGGRFSLLL